MRREWFRGWAVAAAVLAPLAGCSGPAPDVGQVTGVATFNGRPHHEIQVRFYPDGDARGPVAEGVTDGAGRYTLYHCPAGEADSRPGALAGRYKVVLVDQSRAVPRDGGRMAPSAVPARYGNPFTTPLTFDVKPGDNVIDLDVK